MTSTQLEKQPVEPGLPGALTTMGYSPPQGMSYEEWERAVGTLLTMHRTIGWWVGDALNFGEDTFGEQYAQVIEVGAGSFEASTLTNFMRVARCVPYPRRREELTFTHHAEVAALEPVLADTLLDRAVENQWTSRQLRAVKLGRDPDAGPLVLPPSGVPSNAEAAEKLKELLANESFLEEEVEDLARGIYDARADLAEHGWPSYVDDEKDWALAKAIAQVGIRALMKPES